MTRPVCPLCGASPDRSGACDRGHPPLRSTGVTFLYGDYRDNVCVDADAPVLAWRQARGHRLAYENSHEAVAWSLFRGLEVLGALGATLRQPLGLRGEPVLRFWARSRDAEDWSPFVHARAQLEEHIRGPDATQAEPDLILLDERGGQVLFVEAALASTLTSARLPSWFAHAGQTAAASRRRRAILDGLQRAEERAPFRRGVGDAIRRGFYRLARRLLLARAVARQLGSGWVGRLVSIVNPPTMRHVGEDAARFRDLLQRGAEDAYASVSWSQLWAHVPAAARSARRGAGGVTLRCSLEQYLRGRTVNRVPARLCHPE